MGESAERVTRKGTQTIRPSVMNTGKSLWRLQNKYRRKEMSEFYPVCLPDDVSQLCSELCSKLCSITGTTGSSAASHFFRSPLETGRASAADLSCVAAEQELGWVEGGAAVSVSSTGLWALRFWLSLRRICFFSLCDQTDKNNTLNIVKFWIWHSSENKRPLDSWKFTWTLAADSGSGRVSLRGVI